MSDDLNDFLKQAALRREARKKAGNAPAPSPRSMGNQNQRSSTARKTSIPVEPIEVLEPIPVEQRHLTPHIPASDHLAGNVAEADKKRAAHMQEAFGQSSAPLERQQTKKSKQKSKAKPQAAVPQIASKLANVMPDPNLPPETTGSSPGASVRSPQELLKMLRDPQTIRTAFIASEIFGRKFQ